MRVFWYGYSFSLQEKRPKCPTCLQAKSIYDKTSIYYYYTVVTLEKNGLVRKLLGSLGVVYLLYLILAVLWVLIANVLIQFIWPIPGKDNASQYDKITVSWEMNFEILLVCIMGNDTTV